MNHLWTRRRLLRAALVTGAGSALSSLALARGGEPVVAERTLELFNTHTSERLSLVYRRGDEYIAGAIAGLRNLLRDHRNGEAHDIDVRLYDQLHDLATAAGREPRFQVISGYRSPASNAAMAARPGSGVARHSLHMQGQAIDVRLHACSCAELRDLALAARRGGVGYYRKSDFENPATHRIAHEIRFHTGCSVDRHRHPSPRA
jgi:uncharacterized protein YcbK (DUF882 family)